ncbi:hypothetical protein [Lysobacter sp. cf310]|uniref:hypothetical protein n=1 Tax=Lysobacter sp. cf310 TaxID=1761790 RepID=UPI0011139538|nr:hypothetical protein [Lysobacter sp. cf310]
MTSGTVNIGLCPTPDETRMTVPMLRAVLCGARRLRRFGPRLVRIAAGGDEPSGPRRIAALDAQGASDRDDRPEGRSLLAAYRSNAACGMRVWMHGRAIGLQPMHDGARLKRASRRGVALAAARRAHCIGNAAHVAVPFAPFRRVPGFVASLAASTTGLLARGWQAGRSTR